MSATETIPARSKPVITIRLAAPSFAAVSSGTFAPEFQGVKAVLSSHPLRRPNRTAPLAALTNEDLKRIARSNPPPEEWFEGESVCPF